MTQYVPLVAVLHRLAAVPHIQAEMRRYFADLVCVPEGQSAEWLRTFDYESHQLRAVVRQCSESGRDPFHHQKALHARQILDAHAGSQPEPNMPPEFPAWLATYFELRTAFIAAVEASVEVAIEEREEATREMNTAHTVLLEHSHRRPSAAFLRVSDDLLGPGGAPAEVDEPVPAEPTMAEDLRAIRQLLERTVEGQNALAVETDPAPTYRMEVVGGNAPPKRVTTHEQLIALREAHRTTDVDAYFEAREPDRDTPGNRSYFEVGFDRGFAAALMLTEEGHV